MGGASAHRSPRKVRSGQRTGAAPNGGCTRSAQNSTYLRSPPFLRSSSSFWDRSSICLPLVMASHMRQGCCPSKVESIASTTDTLKLLEMTIPVQAVVCKIIQCAPLKESAQQRMSILWKADLTPRVLSCNQTEDARTKPLPLGNCQTNGGSPGSAAVVAGSQKTHAPNRTPASAAHLSFPTRLTVPVDSL